jgi:hypothetical protein
MAARTNAIEKKISHVTGSVGNPNKVKSGAEPKRIRAAEPARSKIVPSILAKNFSILNFPIFCDEFTKLKCEPENSGADFQPASGKVEVFSIPHKTLERVKSFHFFPL